MNRKVKYPWQNNKCRKKAYKDKDMAVSALHLINSRGEDRNRGYKPIRYYLCMFCNKYHITSQPSEYGEW